MFVLVKQFTRLTFYCSKLNYLKHQVSTILDYWLYAVGNIKEMQNTDLIEAFTSLNYMGPLVPRYL